MDLIILVITILIIKYFADVKFRMKVKSFFNEIFGSSSEKVINGDNLNAFTSSPSHMSVFKRVLYWFVGIVVVLIVLSVGLPFFIVSPGEVGLIKRLGSLQESYYTEGLNFKIPFVDDVVIMDIKTQKIQDTANSASKDLQNVQTTIAINGSIDPAKAVNIYRTVGTIEVIADKVITPAIQESVKSVTAKYTAEELITKRAAVSTEIKQGLVDKLTKYGLNVSDVNIVNFQFSEDFDQAIEKKVKAEQDALAEKNKLEAVKFQAQQKIEQSKAEAESIRIQAEAIKSQGGAEYVNLKWIEKRDGKLPSTSLANGNGLIYNLNN